MKYLQFYGTVCVLGMIACGSSPAPPAPELGAVATYTPTEADVRVARIGDMLIGRVPGLEVLRHPNGNYTLRIRGPRNLRGDGVPLLILDGSPVPMAILNTVTPHNIVQVKVLRDAASTAVYGSRGVYGVVIITTGSPTEKR